MKINYTKILSILLPTAIFLPSLAFAASDIFPSLVKCDGVTIRCDFNAAVKTVNAFIQWFLNISVSVAAITFAFAGGKMLLNPNNPSARESAKIMFYKTVIGLLVVLGAWLIIHTIATTLIKPTEALNSFIGQ